MYIKSQILGQSFLYFQRLNWANEFCMMVNRGFHWVVWSCFKMSPWGTSLYGSGGVGVKFNKLQNMDATCKDITCINKHVFPICWKFSLYVGCFISGAIIAPCWMRFFKAPRDKRHYFSHSDFQWHFCSQSSAVIKRDSTQERGAAARCNLPIGRSERYRWAAFSSYPIAAFISVQLKALGKKERGQRVHSSACRLRLHAPRREKLPSVVHLQTSREHELVSGCGQLPPDVYQGGKGNVTHLFTDSNVRRDVDMYCCSRDTFSFGVNGNRRCFLVISPVPRL